MEEKLPLCHFVNIMALFYNLEQKDADKVGKFEFPIILNQITIQSPVHN